MNLTSTLTLLTTGTTKKIKNMVGNKNFPLQSLANALLRDIGKNNHTVINPDPLHLTLTLPHLASRHHEWKINPEYGIQAAVTRLTGTRCAHPLTHLLIHSVITHSHTHTFTHHSPLTHSSGNPKVWIPPLDLIQRLQEFCRYYH